MSRQKKEALLTMTALATTLAEFNTKAPSATDWVANTRGSIYCHITVTGPLQNCAVNESE